MWGYQELHFSCQKIDAFELWCWRRLLRVPWTAGRSNQSILMEISPGCSLEDWCWNWNSSTLATSREELTHWKIPWCWEGLGAGGEGDNRGSDGWMASPTQRTWVWVNSRSWWWTGRPGVLRFTGSQKVGYDWVTKLNRTGKGKKFLLLTSSYQTKNSLALAINQPQLSTSNPYLSLIQSGPDRVKQEESWECGSAGVREGVSRGGKTGGRGVGGGRAGVRQLELGHGNHRGWSVRAHLHFTLFVLPPKTWSHFHTEVRQKARG